MKPEKEIVLKIETRGGSHTQVEFKTIPAKKAKVLFSRNKRRTFRIGKVDNA